MTKASVAAVRAYLDSPSDRPPKLTQQARLLICLGSVLRKHRRDRGLKQAEVAKTLGVTQSVLSRIESENMKLSMSRLEEVSTLYEVDPAEVLTEARRLRAEGLP